MPRADVVVIGSGLAGLSCAVELAERGAAVFLAAKGMATTHWTHGGLDVAAPPGAVTPREGVRLLAEQGWHPYARVADRVEDAVDEHRARLAGSGLEPLGTLDHPLRPVPTALGALRPAALLPAGQAAALEPWGGEGLLVLGFRRYRDAWPAYAARNLGQVAWVDGPARIRSLEIDLPWVDRLHNFNARNLGLLFDDPVWRTRALRVMADAIPAGRWRIALPAVLGVGEHPAVLAEAEVALGHRVFEMPSLPPSVPGMRLFDALRQRILAAGGRIQVGFDVVKVERQGAVITAIHTEAAARTLRLAADRFVLATGGIAGEGIRAHRGGRLEERVFGLPVTAPPPDAWFSDDPLLPHPIESLGIAVDGRLRPVDADGAPLLHNVTVIGSAMAGMRYLEQRCGDGVALASAHLAASALAGDRAAA